MKFAVELDPCSQDFKRSIPRRLGAKNRAFETGEEGPEAAQFRDELAKAGLTGDKLKTAVEPLRIAHRLDPATTWLYSAQFDKVVPPANSYLLAKAAMLDP